MTLSDNFRSPNCNSKWLKTDEAIKKFPGVVEMVKDYLRYTKQPE